MSDFDGITASIWSAITRAAEQGESYERTRIVDLLENEIAKHTKVLESRPDRSDSDRRHTICRTLQEAIDLIKKGE